MNDMEYYNYLVSIGVYDLPETTDQTIETIDYTDNL